ncbi:MAG TPA: adenylate/guanylate cyclase domain-containing protein [Gaiellaceae bacterium]|nr:adenylate/guanylate cyclase domain-containing protein [Gaiellaceae bacterium]
MNAETRYAKSGDLRIAYQILGDGPIDLLFAPGYLSHLEQNQWWPAYRAFFDRMASFSRLLVFDRRGTGLSDRILTLGSFEELMDDIAAVLDASGSERAALFGGAEGGPMCALFAATYPERTSALVLGASYARRRWAPDYPWGLDDETQQRILDGYEERWGRVGFGSHSIAPSLVDDERFQDWYAQAQRFSGTPASAQAWFRITMEIDIRGVLPAIRVPTLVIHRAGDRVIPVESGRYLAEHIPGARYAEVPGDDHFPFVGDVDSLVDEVEEFLTGTRPERERNRVLATVLFTDIVDSTRRAAELGDRRWTELLAEHHRRAQEELERHRGTIVRIEGDGTLSTFDGPARAVGCAHALRESVRALGLEIRAGLHTGEVELAATGVEGIAVHIGARIAALGAPGEVLVSSTVKDLVVGSGLEFADRGVYELKGVPGEWRLYSVAD